MWMVLFLSSLALLACAPDSGRGDVADGDVAAIADLQDGVDDGADATEDARPSAASLRAELGIPANAARVLVFGQTAHLDVGWQLTFDHYYRAFVVDIFARALDALDGDPDYRYAICEMAYFRRFWEDHPERHDAIRRFMREGRLEIVGGGVSSPDVLLPLGDNLLRDFRAGLSWLRSVGLPRTHTSWLPDDFGLGPTTPDVLAAVGFDAVAFWRADGSSDTPNFEASAGDFADMPVTPGSGAETLTGAIDFLWEGPGGARVFAHWLAHSYLFGDYLDFERIDFRVLGQPAGTPADLAGILENIATMADLVLPMSPTDYGFVPVGGDFQYPKEDLAAWARAWNASRFPATGLWVVAGTFDDFARLAMTQAERLVVRRLDLTPYWMGFYASREGLKADARLGSAALTQAEAIAAIDRRSIDPATLDRLAWLAGKTNHHDWITGTSTRATFEDEQVPETRELRAGAEALRDRLVGEIAGRVGKDGLVVVNTGAARRRASFTVPWDGPDRAVSLSAGALHDPMIHATVEGGMLRASVDIGALSARTFTVFEGATLPARTAVACTSAGVEVPCEVADQVEIRYPYWTITLDRRSGGTLTSWPGGGGELLGGPSLRLVDFLDEGGLYTFAHELAEPVCGFSPDGEVQPDPGGVALAVDARTRDVAIDFSWEQGGMRWRRAYRVSEEGDVIDVELTVGARAGHTLVARLDLDVVGETWMAVPGGVVIERPSMKRFDPTFWPFERWAARVTPGGAALGVIAPANPALSFTDEGVLDVVLVREEGNACLDPEAGEPRPVTLSLRLVRGLNDVDDDELVTRMDQAADDVYAPLLAARGTATAPGGPAVMPPLIASIQGGARFTGLPETRVRVARFAHTPEGYVLVLERRMVAPHPLRVKVATRFPPGTIIEQLDASEGEGVALAGANPELVAVWMESTYLTLRFRPPP